MIPRLKSLELHGYKTFASRTVFEFPGDITAIVGPNGSGKSNIADSLRWVLGEQSYSLLRGRKTEDMIFSGSEMRPRAGMASATITFSNEDGWLPIDFNEVSITRRAYRDGQNEYLLNGQKVRLKEITELLGRSGLSERTYTIIGQGLVDAALSLKPEERRKFFEEAAGIGLYRARREESLNRLDTTRRNLERVLDILSELGPRLGSLEKQARRAMEYDRIRGELRLLLRDWYGYHWQRIQSEVIHAQEVLRAQEGRLERAREREAEVDVQMSELRGKLFELRGSLSTWHASAADLHTGWEKVNRALAVLDERQRAAQQQQQSIQTDQNRLEEEQKARQTRLQDLMEERDRLQVEQQDAEAQAAEARKNLEKRQSERARVEQTVRDARRQLTQQETQQVQRKAHINEITSRMETLRKNQHTIAQTLTNETQLIEQLQARLEVQTTQRKIHEVEQKAAEEALQDHRKAILEGEGRRKQLQDERARLEAERARYAAQVEVLEQAERSFSGLGGGAKFLLQEARQGRLRGGYQTFGSQLVVPAQYEAAIAAVLGDALDAVVVESSTDPHPAVLLLAKAEKGRAILVPVDWARLPDALPVPPGVDCLGAAVDLVQVPDWLREVANVLLGQALVAEDAAAARRLVMQLPPSARVVTLRGEVFYGTGMVIAGPENHASAIGRPRRMQELHSALAEADKTFQAAQETWQALESDLSRLRAKEREFDSAARQAVQAFRQADQAQQRAALEVEQVRQRYDYQARQSAGLEAQIQRAAAEVVQENEAFAQAGQKISEWNEQVRELNRRLSNLPIEAFQAQVVHWNTGAAVAARALKDAERRLTEHREAISAAARQTEALAQRLRTAVESLNQIDQDKAALRGQEGQLEAQIDALRAQIEPAEVELQGVDKEYQQEQEVFTAAQQAVAVAERYATQAHLELSRVRDSMDSLRRRIEEDFGLVALEFSPEVSGQTPLPMDGMVEQLPAITELSPEIEENLNRQRALLRRMGPINPDVQTEYQSVKERYDFLTAQMADLKKADADLREVIAELDTLMRLEFRKTFDAVAVEFKGIFTRLFGGGSARLVLTDEENPTETGIDIEARLPGRREQGLSLLSGGERSLTAVALICSLLKVSPTPFCVMDEVDAMLDESNVGRYRDLLMELSDKTQFILVTHNRNTAQGANVIYGVTMGRDSASQIISLRLDEISDEMVA